MKEREKMLAGLPYDCGEGELLARWHRAKDLVHRYNNTPSTDREGLTGILRELLGGMGRNLWITAPFFCDYGENIFIGDNSEINHNCVFLDCNRITIGRNALIGPAVQIYAAFHPVRASERLREDHGEGGMVFCITQSAPVTIGDNAWIGGGTIILPGVTIGDNVTIGAGSVVTRSIPSDSLACGNPCVPVRSLK
ncbi:MAG: sugar O-acetyltransferase [Spirochaetes bacterium]|nr:sugar O-acetyltransferase [Spirochaetota bacterium]